MPTVASYTGQNQQQKIDTAADQALSAQGPNAVPPYPQGVLESPGQDIVPPPIQKTDLWSAQQKWPL